MDREYWDTYYRDRQAVSYASPFAEYCIARYVPQPTTVVELGSGSGRDAFFFAEHGHDVTGIDQSAVAVEDCNRRAADLVDGTRLTFTAGDFTRLADLDLPSTNVVYSRFTLHSIDDEAEARVLADAHRLLSPGGLFLIEARTINDGLYGKGEQVGEHEFVTDHYRRHIDAQRFLRSALDGGYQVREFVESAGLAVFRGEDPVVMRVVLST